MAAPFQVFIDLDQLRGSIVLLRLSGGRQGQSRFRVPISRVRLRLLRLLSNARRNNHPWRATTCLVECRNPPGAGAVVSASGRYGKPENIAS